MRQAVLAAGLHREPAVPFDERLHLSLLGGDVEIWHLALAPAGGGEVSTAPVTPEAGTFTADLQPGPHTFHPQPYHSRWPGPGRGGGDLPQDPGAG